MGERKLYFGDDQDAYTMEEIREALEFKNGVSINADEINSGSILNIRDEFKWDITFGDDETKYSYDEIVFAINRQFEPKKVVVGNRKYWDGITEKYYLCPECRKDIEYEWSYCPQCGQRLGMEGVEDDQR